MMRDGSTRIATTLVLVLSLAGCWNAVDTHCRGCAMVSERAPALPPIAPSTRAVVILVHGAFGFGDEWRGVVDAVRARPKTSLVAFAWSGPWTRKPSLAAQALLRIVQRAIDDAPPRAKIVVIAHSAGGALTSFVGERLRVPAGRSVSISSIAPPEGMNLAPYRPEREVDTPLGFAVGGEQAPLGPIAPGVEYVEYETADAPAHPPAARPGVRRVYLGARVGHNESVGLAALPVVRAL
jgi:pimeloyl-ACP methyl ester carboxylesterase